MITFSLQAVQRVGLIGLAIGVPNKASEALIKVAASDPPPLPPRTYKEVGVAAIAAAAAAAAAVVKHD